MRAVYLTLTLCVFSGLQGCTNVEPWDRAYLARNEMKLEPNPLDSKFRRHVYFAREATPGGYGADPSGCGCN